MESLKTYSAAEKQQILDEAERTFEPVTQLSNQQALEHFYRLQSNIPYKLRRRPGVLSLLGEYCETLCQLERFNTQLEKDGFTYVSAKGNILPHPLIPAKHQAATRLAGLATKLSFNVGANAKQKAHHLEREADIKDQLGGDELAPLRTKRSILG